MAHKPDEMVDGDGRKLGSAKPQRALSSSTSKYVQKAAEKAAKGQALTGNERRRLQGFALPPVTSSYVPKGKEAAKFNNSLQPQGRDTLASPGGDDGSAGVIAALEARIEALEAKLVNVGELGIVSGVEICGIGTVDLIRQN